MFVKLSSLQFVSTLCYSVSLYGVYVTITGWNIASGQQSIPKERLPVQVFRYLKEFSRFPWHRLKCENLHHYLLHQPSALYDHSADGRAPSGRHIRPDAPSPLSPQLRCLLLAVFCICTDLSGAAGYHGDHFLKNTGKEEGRQWCKVQEHREATGEKDSKQSKVQHFTAVCTNDFMINSHSMYTLWYKC